MTKSLKYSAKWFFGFLIAVVLVAISAEVLAVEGDKKNRAYPGGVDEDDLKVQPELPTPPLKLDRRTLEQRALQGLLKKDSSTTSKPEERQ